MIDNYKTKGARRRLIEGIQRKGIDDERVIEALYKVPRHIFMESGFIEQAYVDQAFPIGAGQTISQPYTVAFQTQLLGINKGDKILEIGTGSGYQTAVLIELGAKVYTIERQYSLFLKTQSFFHKYGYKAHCFYGDGYIGKPTYGPYNKILITAAAPYISDELKQQLKIGGVLVAPIGDSYSQTMTSIIRISENEYKKEKFGEFVFVPMLKGVEK